MKLLGDVKMYCIKVNYLMWSEEKGEHTEPVYLSIDKEVVSILIFRKEIEAGLRVFDTVAEAEAYIESHNIGLGICCENPEVVAIKYDFDEREWREIGA